MKRFHVHVRVKNLEESIAFYNALFNTEPAIVKSDYAKWMLEDPRINYAISTGHAENGIEHLGLQVETETELQQVFENMQNAKGTVREEGECTCCYSKSQKAKNPGSQTRRELTGKPFIPTEAQQFTVKVSMQGRLRKL